MMTQLSWRGAMGSRVWQTTAVAFVVLTLAVLAIKTITVHELADSCIVTHLRNDLDMLRVGEANELPFRIVARGRDAVTVIGFSQD